LINEQLENTHEFAVPTLAAPLWNVPSASDPDSKRIGDQKQSATSPHSRREQWRSVDRRRESFGVVQPRESDGKGLQLLFNNFNSSFQFADLVHKFMKKIAQRHGNVSSEFSISALR